MSVRPGGSSVGVLGGMFDPVHNGHLQLALEARRLLGLDRSLFVPAANPPHKPAGGLSPVHHRLAMLRLALDDRPGLEIDSVELEQPDVGYTIDTLGRLRDSRPCRPVFLLGADSLSQLDSWLRWRELIATFDLAVMDRLENPATGAAPLPVEIEARIVRVSSGGVQDGLDPGRGGRIFRLPVRPMPVASSDVRRRVRAGGDPSDLVPPAVARYIQSSGLYSREEKR